ncbi:MAG: hypothetical protein PUC42_05660 [Bacteroidales bacterium]|nr:hypothetical protein [Bacteroidales bacterium]
MNNDPLFFNIRKRLFLIFLIGVIILFIFSLFHYRIYYFLGVGVPIYMEILLVVTIFSYLTVWMNYNIGLEHFYLEEIPIVLIFTLGFCFLSFLPGKIIEDDIFYQKAVKEYGMVYSSELVSRWSTKGGGSSCDVRLINGTSSTFCIRDGSKASKKYNLFVYPKLAHDDEFGYFSIYRNKLFETRPTDIQLEYCKDGARLSEKINSLKKYSGVVSENELLDYMAHINQHDNRIISAVVERRGEKYLFANVLQSDDKLWAFKYRDVEEGKKVLIIYDISSPHLFFVIDWNPSEEEYEYYNTKDGQKPTFKYLLKLEHLSKSLQAKNDEERDDG